MAKVLLSPMIKEISGKVGDFVFRRSRTGETIMSRSPDMSGVKWSQAQNAHRQRFKKAVAYAKTVIAEPEVRVRYEELAANAGKRPFDMAVSDYFKGRNLLSE